MLGSHLKEILQNLHLYFNKTLPVNRGIYVSEKGMWAGEFLVYIKTLNSGFFSFLGLPRMTKRDITPEIFNNCIKDKSMVFVEKLPGNIFSACVEQYNFLVDKEKK